VIRWTLCVSFWPVVRCSRILVPTQFLPALRAYVPRGMLEFRNGDESSTFDGISLRLGHGCFDELPTRSHRSRQIGHSMWLLLQSQFSGFDDISQISIFCFQPHKVRDYSKKFNSIKTLVTSQTHSSINNFMQHAQMPDAHLRFGQFGGHKRRMLAYHSVMA
jgi:hypothetical protein